MIHEHGRRVLRAKFHRAEVSLHKLFTTLGEEAVGSVGPWDVFEELNRRQAATIAATQLSADYLTGKPDTSYHHTPKAFIPPRIIF